MIAYYIVILFILLLAQTLDIQAYLLPSINNGVNYLSKRFSLIIRKDKKTFVVLSSLLIFVLLAFKDISVGTDTVSYYLEYNATTALNMPRTLSDFIRGEYGYKTIVFFFRSIGFTWLGFQIVYATFVSAVTGIFIYRHSMNVLNSIILFITVGSFAMSLSGIRQTMAISILLLCYLSLEKRRNVLAILLYISAVSIHYTSLVAIVFFILFLLVKEENKRSNLWLTLGMVIPFVFLVFTGPILRHFSGLLLNKYEYSGYFTTLNYSMNPIVFFMYWSMFIFIFFGLYIRRNNITKKDICFYLMSALFIGFYEASRTVYMMSRLTFFFSFFFIISVTNAIDYYPLNIRSKKIVAFAIGVLCLVAFAISIPGSSYGIDHYTFWWK